MTATSDVFKEFISRSLQLIDASATSEFLDNLSLAVGHVVSPGLSLSPELLALALKEILPYNLNLSAQILDIISQYWVDQSPDARGPLIVLLQTLIKTNVVTTDLAIELVDRNILQDTAVISNSQILATRSVRINTGLLYKQQKFNLLREENEGYAKLSHELNAALSELPKGGLIDASDISTRAEELLTVVNALIGYFELDPNRVFDNILDICSQNLLSHSRFILHFLHHSPWAPSALCVPPPFSFLDHNDKRSNLDSIQRDFIGHFRMEMSREGGSQLAAQLLGFKLRFFATNVDTNERGHVSPESLIFLTALLIKSGFVKLSDLWPYLNPTDNAIGEEYRIWKEEMEERAYMAKSNALALAGALGDGEDVDNQKPKAVETTESKIVNSAKPMETNQKAALLHALLAVGSLTGAVQLLSLHPKISGPHSSIADGIHRLLHVSIDPIYKPVSPSCQFEQRVVDGLKVQKKRAVVNRTSPGNVEWLDDLERKSVRGYNPFPKQEFSDRNVRFFLDDDVWAQDIPVCETMEDFYAIVINLLRFSGPRLGNDVSLLVKLVRIGKTEFQKRESSSLPLHQWIELSRVCLIPAVSLIGANPGVVNEIYELVRYFPYPARFSLYGEWQMVAYKLHPELKLKASETDKDTKSILRRISKQDVKRFGRALAKTSTSNPLILWAVAINQIENYDNFVEVVVDAAKFCTNLGYDVLEFVILSSLANPFKNRVKEDGTSIAIWLTGLSAFCAKVFRRYASMDVSTVTTYVACQLKVSNIYDLIVLRDLITQMAGILVRENLSDHQLRCYSGGDGLKEQAMSLLREPGSMVGLKKSSARILKALMDANLAGLMLVLIAQERGSSLFNPKTEHTSNLKLLGNLFDECHGVLLQFHDFIVSNLDLPSLEKLFPSFKEIVKEYGIEPPVAFYLWRPILAEKIRQYDVDLSIQMQKKKLLRELAITEKLGEAQIETPNSSPSMSETGMQDVSQDPSSTKDGTTSHAEEQDGDIATANSEEPWHPALRDFIEEASQVIPSEVWNYMSPQFYTTFWQLNLYDILVPMQAYTQEVSKLTSEIKKKDADRTDMTPQAVQRRRRERERLQALVDQLNQEFKTQTSVYQSTKLRLSKEKDFWFDWANFLSGPVVAPPRNRTVLAILQHCIIPRCLFGPNEAIFSARFIREMHRLGTKNFSSLTLFDKIFVNVHETVIFTGTNREAENYGRFLREVLMELTRWYLDKSTYEKEAISPSTPGFLKKWSLNPSEVVYLQYEEYRSVMFKWHKNMTTAFKNCLESKDYMHVRNALAVLEKIIGQYPQVDFHGSSLEEKVSVIAAKEETRGDLQVRAQGYLALLRKSSKSWVTAAKFSAQPRSAISPASSPNVKRPATPQALPPTSTTAPSLANDRPDSARTKSTLNPTAQSFKPQDEIKRKFDEVADSDGAAVRSKRTLGPVLPESIVGSKSENLARPASNSRTSSQTPKDSVDGDRAETDKSSVQQPMAESRSLRSNEPDQRKADIIMQERSPRQRDESSFGSSEQSSNRNVNNIYESTTSRLDRSNKSKDETHSATCASDQHSIPRILSSSSNQSRDVSGSRPRTPEGPRGITDISRSLSPSQRATNQRDFQASRQQRYDSTRPNNTTGARGTQGFRAPPPTGPRAAAVSTGPSMNAPRQQHATRIASDPARGSRISPPPSERDAPTISSSAAHTPITRAAMLGQSEHEVETDSSKVQRSTPTNELRSSKSRATQSDDAGAFKNSEAPRGPSDWRGRSKRDLQDDDPRRLSRAADEGGDNHDRQTRPSEENVRSHLSRQMESTKEVSSGKARAQQEKTEREQNETLRSTRESRPQHDGDDIVEGRKTRTTVRHDTNDRETSGRTHGASSASSQSERVKLPVTSETKAVESSGSKELASREQKNPSADQKIIHREKPDSISRDRKDQSSLDQKSASQRVEETRRTDDRDVTSRSRREEAKDLRHDRLREGYHGRVLSRRSPSRSHSDRSDKKEKDRENERRSGARRESRDPERGEKDRVARETDHRRETHERGRGRDRDRTSRDKESDGRRGSRKHDREKSMDAVDRGTRPANSGEVGTEDDSSLPNKRRRIVR